ncbi:MAG: type II toxin-antitoxin system RelE/ParE family toxin [Proteobacteria bacterium]|nr:type II toxin-antitoxin system RelE/ParE family toxin [Pseudomonadota bacterium]
MARRLRVSALAAGDIDRIAGYSRQRWGIEVAVRYLLGLDAAIRRLRRLPSLGSNYGKSCRVCGAISTGRTSSTISSRMTASGSSESCMFE